VLSAVLVVVVAVAVGVAVPTRVTHNWTPFAPHGWWAVGTAANILMWLFIGWEAMAQLAGEFRDPARDLPRAMALAFAVITALYSCLAVATIVTAAGGSRVPLADLIATGFGRTGRDATAVLAVTLTMGTMNVYTGSVAKLAAALALDGALPRWLGGDAERSIPRRPLLALGCSPPPFSWRSAWESAARATSSAARRRASSRSMSSRSRRRRACSPGVCALQRPSRSRSSASLRSSRAPISSCRRLPPCSCSESAPQALVDPVEEAAPALPRRLQRLRRRSSALLELHLRPAAAQVVEHDGHERVPVTARARPTW
jgi:hypothetical protein